MNKVKETVRTPTYFVRRRLMKNKPAMLGFAIIVLAHLVSFLGYMIMPDDTPNADDRSPHIKKKAPGFEVRLLKTIKQREVYDVNFLEYIFFGQESVYKIEPISWYKIEGLNIKYAIYDRENETLSQPLINTVKQLYSGFSENLKPDSVTGYNYQVVGDSIRYLGLKEQLHTISHADLIKEFEEKNIEDRTYYLGTSIDGRDLMSMILFGTKISLSIGFISVVISLIVGVSLGAIAGFFGGWVDNLIMWLMTVVWSIPSIMLVIAISLALQSKGIWVAFVAVGLTMWVEAAKALGIGNLRIIFVHILPNVVGPIIVIATANFATAILVEAGLSFLGLGVQPPMPSWGKMVFEGYNSNWESDGGFLVFLPSLCICLLVFAFNLFGNGLRDAYDPQSANKW